MEKRKNYICHDGIQINDSQLFEMAKQAGSYQIAEHYLVSILAYALQTNQLHYIDLVNDVREHYGVSSLHIPKEVLGSGGGTIHEKRLNDMLRKRYRQMSIDERQALLTECLSRLRVNHQRLFSHKKHWLGIFMVIKDRLDLSLKGTDFLVLAQESTPAGWPTALSISESVLKNRSRDFPTDDPDEAYYEMENNPQQEFCDTFWEIVKQCMMSQL